MCDNVNEKLKYNDKGFDRELELNKIINIQGMFPTTPNHQLANVDIETKLLKSKSTYIKKNNIKLDVDEDNKNKDYRNFSMTSDKNRETLNHGDYIKNGFKGNGRGFGNYDVDVELRFGLNSREDKKTARSHDLKDYKFNSMFPNFNDANNVVLPFARGGIDTRNLDKYRVKN